MHAATRETKFENRLLASLPEPIIKQLMHHLTRVQLPRNFKLQEPGKTVEFVYFPETGVCSIVATVEEGESVEVGLIGREGFVGSSAVLGVGQSPNPAFMQIPGHGFRMPARTLVRLADEHAPLRACLLRSVQSELIQATQTAACNRVHELHERLARWLLMCHDRVKQTHIAIAQEFLATMLGTRRSSVTVAAGTLQKAGLIECKRGWVILLDREGLMAAACECYKVVHDETMRLGLLD